MIRTGQFKKPHDVWLMLNIFFYTNQFSFLFKNELKGTLRNIRTLVENLYVVVTMIPFINILHLQLQKFSFSNAILHNYMTA